MTEEEVKAKAMMSRVTAYTSSGDIHSEEFHRGFIVMGFKEDSVTIWQDLTGAELVDVIRAIVEVMEKLDITTDDLTNPLIRELFEED